MRFSQKVRAPLAPADDHAAAPAGDTLCRLLAVRDWATGEHSFPLFSHVVKGWISHHCTLDAQPRLYSMAHLEPIPFPVPGDGRSRLSMVRDLFQRPTVTNF